MQILFSVRCENCRCQTAYFETEKDALKAWNRRANDDSID